MEQEMGQDCLKRKDEFESYSRGKGKKLHVLLNMENERNQRRL